MLSTFEYSEFEKQKNHDLDKLMNEWIEQLSKNKTPIDNGNKETTTPSRLFCKRRFFPRIFRSKKENGFYRP